MNHQVFKESELESHIAKNLFHFQLECGKSEFQRQIKTMFTSNPSVLKKRQDRIQILRNHFSQRPLYADYEDVIPHEKVLQSYKPTQESKTGEQAIFFTGKFQHLNQIPFLLTLCYFLKVYLAPIFGLLTPLFLFCMPFFIMKYTMNMDVPWDMYMVLIKSTLFGIQNGQSLTLKHYGQIAWTLASLGQSMIQPCFTAFQTKKVDEHILRRGESLLFFVNRGKEILQWFKLLRLVPNHYIFPEIPSDPRQAAAWMDEEPLGMYQIWRLWGEIDLLFTLSKEEWKPVQWNSNEEFSLSHFHDLAIPAEKAVKSSIHLQKHALFTGPNRGGKSSTLRAILQQVILGQTFGQTFGNTQGSWKPFSHIFTRLASKDNAGKESLFEMEVRNAAKMLKTLRVSKKHTLVLIDELFHSTNPPDAETSARIFLKQLWEFSNAKSLISTHIFSLCEGNLPIQTFCCPASDENGDIHYTYRLEPGICRVSSVREVLKEHKILRV